MDRIVRVHLVTNAKEENAGKTVGGHLTVPEEKLVSVDSALMFAVTIKIVNRVKSVTIRDVKRVVEALVTAGTMRNACQIVASVAKALF